MADKRVEYTIGVKNEGLENLTKVIDELDKAGVETTEFKREAEQLRKQLAEMARQQSLIDSFVKIKQETVSAGSAFEAAQAKAQKLGRELSATDAPTKRQTAEFGRAREAVNSTKDAYQAAQVRLQGMRGTLAENNIETAGLAQKQAALRNGVREVDTSVAGATARLKELGGSGPKAVNDTAAATDRAAASSKNYEGALTKVAKAVGGLFAATKVVGFAKDTIAIADAYGQMAERIEMASGSADEYDLVQRRLLESANLTYRSLTEQQELYIQTAAALRTMQYSTADVLDITDSFSYLLTTNAASAEKGKNAIDAYTKSIQSGRVEVDSWQSIMAATPTIVDAIATATNKTAAEVRQLGITGQLAIGDLNEGLRQTVELNKSAAAGMSATVSDAVTRLSNTWSVYVGEANRAHQSTEKIVFLIDQLSSNLDQVVSVAVIAGEVMVAVWGVKALNALKTYTAGLRVAAAETSALMATTTTGASKMAAGIAAAGKVAAAGWIGWEVGTFLKDEFEVVEKAGIALAAGLTKTAARAQSAWQMMKAAFTDDTIAAAQERLRLKLIEIDDEYAQLFVSADRAADKQKQTGEAATQAGTAAANATVQWENLRKDYEAVNKELEGMATQTQKVATLKNAEAAAAVAMAQAFGTEKEQREQAAVAANVQAAQLEALAKQRQIEVIVLNAERDALLAIGEELVRINPEKAKQLDDLNKQIALREADAGAALAQASAGQVAATAARAQAEATQDNSKRVGELAFAYEQARDKVERLRTAQQAGKATIEEVTKAELEAGRAALLYRDALQDQLQAIDAKRNLQLASLDVQGATVRLAIEQQKAIYEVAKARGDEGTAMAAQNEIRRLEIELLLLTAQAKRAEADAAIASAQAKKAELIAAGQYNGAKKLEIEASIKAAQVKRLEGDIAEVTANKLRNLAAAQGTLKNSTDSATGAIDRQASAMERLAEGVERVGEGYRNKDGMTSDAQGNVQQQFVYTRAYIIDYLKQAGLEDKLAEELAKQFVKSDGTVDYLASDAQKKWGGKHSTLSEALGKMVDHYKYNDEGKAEAANRSRFLNGEEGDEAKSEAASTGRGSAPISQGKSAGPSYVSNITIDGRTQRLNYADRNSQLGGDALMRQLAQDRGVAQ